MKFNQLLCKNLGDTVHDMYDGLHALEEKLEDCHIESFIQWDCVDGAEFIEKQTGRQRTNKHLVIVDCIRGKIVCNYSYDGKYFGVVVIVKNS